jgi:hypothetical protein
MGHKRGKRKRERLVVEKALGVGSDDDEDFPFNELGEAVVSGKCPKCGCVLEKVEDEVERGLRCPKGDWGVSFSKR